MPVSPSVKAYKVSTNGASALSFGVDSMCTISSLVLASIVVRHHRERGHARPFTQA
jgi:hypothetical protein